MDAVARRRAESGRELAAVAIDEYRSRVEDRLSELLDGHEEACPRLVDSMRYSLLAPGKRVRPMLAILTAVELGRDPAPVIEFGCALELVHCASLLLDDLPCMDDAGTRRGQPATHVRFGEATTTLAAIALLNQAYGMLARASEIAPSVRARLVAELSAAVGTAGLVSGQSRDLAERQHALEDGALDRINRQKTGVLFEVAVVGAGLILELPETERAALARYAGHVGLAFQAADDLLDAHRLAVATGKDCGTDVGKSGSVHQLGEDALRERLAAELSASEARLERIGSGRGVLRGYVRALFGDLL